VLVVLSMSACHKFSAIFQSQFGQGHRQSFTWKICSNASDELHSQRIFLVPSAYSKIAINHERFISICLQWWFSLFVLQPFLEVWVSCLTVWSVTKHQTIGYHQFTATKLSCTSRTSSSNISLCLNSQSEDILLHICKSIFSFSQPPTTTPTHS
jgi:hypothetical protein